MEQLFKAVRRLPFALVAVPRVLFVVFRREARVSYLRWRYRAVHFEDGCYVDDASKLEDGVRILTAASVTNCSIGMNSYVGRSSAIANCVIGRYCSIGPQVMIGLGVHPIDGMVSTYPGFYSANKHPVNFRTDVTIKEYRPVRIGHDVWIGARAIVLDGVTIGNGAIVAAGCIVTKDVEPYTIVGGVPARLIRRRFTAEDAQLLSDFAWWDRGTAFCREHAKLFNDSDAFCSRIRTGDFDGGMSKKQT